MVSNGGNEGGAEIAFFDVETTIPTRPGQKYALLEFGSILVSPKTLVELDNYSTLIRPDNPSLISTASVNCNGITRDDVVSAPSFSQVADTVYNLLHGRVWAGHNIIRFDCVRIKEAFAEINRPPPEPKGIIDSLPLLTQTFGRRAGNMKMATLATYFGLGQQTHRSLGDVRMNLEVIKYCATVLFLESSLPDIFTSNSLVSPNATTRSRGNWGVSPEETIKNKSIVSSSKLAENHTTSSPIDSTIGENLPTFSTTNPTIGENHPILSLRTSITEDSVVNQVESDIVPPNRFNMTTLSIEMERQSLQLDDTVMESGSESVNSIPANSFDASSGYTEFLKPNEVSLPSITVILSPYYRGLQRLQILHRNTALHLCCSNLKVRFGISTKFVDSAGRPRLSFVADAHPDICRVLDACDNLAKRMSLDSGSGSEWRPVVTRKYGFVNSPTIRLHLPTVPDGNAARWTTEMYHKESSTTQRIVFSRYDVTELDALFVPGTNVDVYFSLDPYDYLQTAEMDKKQAMSDGSGSSGDETTNSLTKAARILLCDTDVESCRENFTLLRQCSDYQVTMVISASEVMSALNSWGPETDIILADVSLLMSGGAQLLKYITQNQDFIHIPVIKEDVSLILKGLGLGAADYVMKPLSATEVLNLWTHISKTRRFP